MNIIEKTLIFYVVTVLVMLYFLSGVRLPLGGVIYRIKPLRERMLRRARERKINAKIVRLVFPRRPKTLSEIVLASILYLFLGYLILSKIFFFAVVMSDSMRPTFEKGDLVLIQTLSKEPQRGDIILFSGFIELDEEKREFIIHRVYSISKDGTVKTKGDAMPMPDPWVVPPEKIVGKAVMLFGQPVVVKHVGESLILEPGKVITNPIVLQYVLGTTRNMGMTVFLILMILYLLLEIREQRLRRAAR